MSWQPAFTNRISLLADLPAVADRLQDLGFLQSLRGIISCIRSEEADYARRELQRVFKDDGRVAAQVAMNGDVLKQCLKAILDALIDSVWTEDAQQCRPSYYQTFKIEEEDYTEDGRLLPKNYDEDEVGKKLLFKSPQVTKQKPTVKHFVSPKQQIPASAKQHNSKIKEFESKSKPEVKHRPRNSKLEVEEEQQVEKKKIKRAGEVIPKSEIIVSPKETLPKSSRVQNSNAAEIADSKKSFKTARSPRREREPTSPASVGDADLDHRNQQVNPASPPKQPSGQKDKTFEASAQDQPQQDAFSRRIAMSVKKKLLGNSAPLDVEHQ